ncbi:MAG: molybdenum cofactor guanylyltransferase [Gammaproteobacteria bacterium]|nr:molybdenum cofactor guanylyltransferase [Gammaproteobacteria bacterium]
MEYPKQGTTGIILAGGRASRMGGTDKGLVPLARQPMIAHVIAALQPQVATILINANRNADRYGTLGFPVVPDQFRNFAGPLAGMASGMRSASTPYVLVAPCDSPLIGHELGPRMHRRLVEADASVCVASDGARTQPVFLFMRRDLVEDMVAFLESGERKIDKWFARHPVAVAEFADHPEWFQNANSPAELQEIERQMDGGPKVAGDSS